MPFVVLSKNLIVIYRDKCEKKNTETKSIFVVKNKVDISVF